MAHDEDFFKNRNVKCIENKLSHIFQYDVVFMLIRFIYATEFFIFDF